MFDDASKADKGYNGEDIFRKFCQINRLCCMIRSHPTKVETDGKHGSAGKKFFFHYNAISLCSGSSQKSSPFSSVALVTRSIIRLIRVDTLLRS